MFQALHVMPSVGQFHFFSKHNADGTSGPCFWERTLDPTHKGKTLFILFFFFLPFFLPPPPSEASHPPLSPSLRLPQAPSAVFSHLSLRPSKRLLRPSQSKLPLSALLALSAALASEDPPAASWGPSSCLSKPPLRPYFPPL